MASWGQIYGNTYATQLLNHFVEALSVFDVPFGVGGFDLKDVRCISHLANQIMACNISYQIAPSRSACILGCARSV